MLSVLLSAGVVCAGEVNVTDSYAAGLADDTLCVSVATENVISSSEISTSDVSGCNDSFEVSLSDSEVSESDNLDDLSTNDDNAILADSIDSNVNEDNTEKN